MNPENLTSRKFILTVLCAGLVSTAFFLKMITDVEWLTFLTVNILGYGALNILDGKKDNSADTTIPKA
jgi:hypothetical protein